MISAREMMYLSFFIKFNQVLQQDGLQFSEVSRRLKKSIIYGVSSPLHFKKMIFFITQKSLLGS